MSVIQYENEAFEASFPVVVVGAGAAGLVAALAAREAGSEVLVLERDALPRGSTALSAGLIPAPATRWQAEAGIEDSPELFAADIMAKAGHAPDPALVRTVAHVIGPTLEWLHARHGLAFSVVTDFRYPGHCAHRMHGLPSRSGLELIDALRDAAEAAGVMVLCGAHVTSLIAGSGDMVRGVAYQRPDGTEERVGCGALVLACNGYGGNRQLVQAHIPELADALYFGHPGNQGMRCCGDRRWARRCGICPDTRATARSRIPPASWLPGPPSRPEASRSTLAGSVSPTSRTATRSRLSTSCGSPAGSPGPCSTSGSPASHASSRISGRRRP